MNKKKNKRDDFLDLVPRGTRRLLDVGCGSGGLSITELSLFNGYYA